jgi:hypothetical protein
MNQITFESSQWYDAATLSERVSGFHARGERPENRTLDDDSSPRRLGRWAMSCCVSLIQTECRRFSFLNPRRSPMRSEERVQ